MQRFLRWLPPANVWGIAIVALGTGFARGDSADGSIILNDDGAWSWFQDERAIIAGHQVIAGSVATGHRDPTRKGNVEVVAYDGRAGTIFRAVLHERLEADDHDSPSLWRDPQGHILALYAKHGKENRVYFRRSTRPDDIRAWEPEQTFSPSADSKITYSNLHWLSQDEDGAGRLYNFFRGYEATFKPSWMFSDDLGSTWKTGGLLIDFAHEFKHRPYVKYASDGTNTVHFVFTEGHPRNFDNSIYHAFLRQGNLHNSQGTVIRSLDRGPITPGETTRVFQGDENNVAWTHDIALDPQGNPRVVYSVQKNSAGLPPGQGGSDHRYRYAFWNGEAWQDQEIAYAGRRLYAGEDDYTGGICLHPNRAGVVFISTRVHPMTKRTLPSRHHEIFRGTAPATAKGAWSWEPVTAGSTVDNLRPVVPQGVMDDGKIAVLWLRGQYHNYTEYKLEIVMQLLHEK